MMEQKDSIVKRISQIMEKDGHSVNTFARKLGISWTLAKNIVSGKNTPSYETLVKILENFEWVDANWLLLGKSAPEENIQAIGRLQKIINTQQRTIDSQQQTIDRLTTILLQQTSEEKSDKKMEIVR